MTEATRRCAIYTRKSSEEGLEQDFNSLHAQRESCEAFIASQRGEGWKLIKTPYNDGGLSGGNMDRPALRQLLTDVQEGKVDVIVVYKVDRLTRSLADFAKMVELFDKQGVSFVAVTQQFNTTTSMGRLTLNVLLSFAQFEREVTGERIRDKIAASKSKGMWMGGCIPLGYRVESRKLLVEPNEANVVRDIFQRYLKCSGVRELARELKDAGVRSRNRAGRSEALITRSGLYKLLCNTIYIGKIPHKDKRYQGMHEGIIDADVFQQVQAKLAAGAVREGGERRSAPSELIGKILDESGRCLTPSHAVKKNGRRYRYYISTGDTENGWRLPAEELERRVLQIALEALNDKPSLAIAALVAHVPEEGLPDFLEGLRKARPELSWVERVGISQEAISVAFMAPGEPQVRIEKTIPWTMQRRGIEQRLVIPAKAPESKTPDPAMIKAIGRALRWWEMLRSGQAKSLGDVAKAENVSDQYVVCLLPLAFMAPKLVEAVVAGQQPPHLTTSDLLYKIKMQGNWEDQREAMGFG